MVDNDIYKGLLLIYESYMLVKDSDKLHDDIKDILLNLTTFFVDLNYNINGVGKDENDNIINEDIIIIDKEMEKLIEEIKNKGDINNIDKKTLDKIMLEYGKTITKNCNTMDFITEETAEEVDKLIEELTIELGD